MSKTRKPDDTVMFHSQSEKSLINGLTSPVGAMKVLFSHTCISKKHTCKVHKLISDEPAVNAFMIG